jgi:eukaryotic-like serine/threonine-protein kinase
MNCKNILSIFLSFLLSQAIYAQKKADLDPEKIKWENHTTADKLLRVRMPVGWEIDEKFMTYQLFVKSPYEGEADNFAENLSIYYQTMQGNSAEFMLKTYIEEAKIQIVRLLGESNMTEPRYFSLKGTPACEYTCVSEQDGTKLKWKQLCIIKGQRIFTLTFTAALDDFSRYVHIADIMMQSVEIR